MVGRLLEYTYQLLPTTSRAKSVVQTHESLQVVLLRVRVKTVVGTLHYGVNCSLQ